MGLHLSIDYFGTDYSAPAYSGELPIDCLKGDRSFVANRLSSPRIQPSRQPAAADGTAR